MVRPWKLSERFAKSESEIPDFPANSTKMKALHVDVTEFTSFFVEFSPNL